jgi:prophage tail gpP-like protein
MKLILVNSEGKKDITQLASRIVWSGEYSQVARRMEVTLASSPEDYYLPKAPVSAGNALLLYEGTAVLFSGYVFSKEKSYKGNSMLVTAYDGAIYLLKNEAAYNFKKTTAEGIAQKICKDFGLPAGSFVKTGIVQSFISIGDSLYDIIMKAYTKAAQQNGKKYILMMVDGKLTVMERGLPAIDYILENGKDLTDSTYTESIESMVNTVKIVNEVGDTATDTVTFKE